MRTRRPGTRRAAEMAALIAACDRSGVAQRVFAARHGMTPGAFAWWRHALGGRRGRPRRPGPAFVEVTPQAAARATAPTGSRAAAYVVRLPSGTWVRIPAQFEAAPLEILLGVLRRTC